MRPGHQQQCGGQAVQGARVHPQGLDQGEAASVTVQGARGHPQGLDQGEAASVTTISPVGFCCRGGHALFVFCCAATYRVLLKILLCISKSHGTPCCAFRVFVDFSCSPAHGCMVCRRELFGLWWMLMCFFIFWLCWPPPLIPPTSCGLWACHYQSSLSLR